MRSAIGFTAIRSRSPDSRKASGTALKRSLSHFNDINLEITKITETELYLWGRGELRECLHRLQDGSMLALIGSPTGEISWTAVEERLFRAERPADFELPWDGRAILLKISPDGKHWILWNDWLGSIPVFHAPLGRGWIASTLEPAVVAALRPESEDIFLPGLISLLTHGNYLSDWTLFKNMKVVPPDCVAGWNERGFSCKQIYSIKPTNENWEEGWDELVDQMYELSRQAIVEALQANPTWIVPLSGGFDSRLIAAVGADMGSSIRTYTWGLQSSLDVIYARQIARALDLPWKWINPGNDYLAKYVHLWADLFGSAMHFHGMYQMPFLDALRSEPGGAIASGFLGECMAGHDVRRQLLLFSSPDRLCQTLPDGYLHWYVKEIRPLFKIEVADALEELAVEIERQNKAVPGPLYQRLRFLNLWGRQRHFTYFSSMLNDYWHGVSTPYLNRAYARFSFSLPRPVLEERRLQADVFRRYYPKLAAIPLSYTNKPACYNGSYLLKRRIARRLPKSFLLGPLRGFNPSSKSMDGECVKNTGKAALWPIYDVWDRLGDWFHMHFIEAACKQAEAGDLRSVRRLQSIQAFAYRLIYS
jgi:hypothetical protein